MLDIIRTTKLKLDLPLEVAKGTVDAWTQACNAISQIAFEQGCLSNAVKLHQLAYEQAKRFGLSAQVAQSAIRHVGSQYASARSNGHLLTKPIVFRQQAVILQGGKRQRDVGFKANGISIWTLDGRIKGVRFQGQKKIHDYLTGWRFCDGRLFVKGDKVYLAVAFKKTVQALAAPNDAVIGVDRGINVIAAATDGRRAKLFGGGKLKQVRRRYTQVRAALQRKKARKGSRSVRKVLKRLSGRERRFQRNENHRISKAVVEFGRASGNPTIALEDLGGVRQGRTLRQAQRTDLNRWAFYELERFIDYKAETLGMEVIKVDARHTSQGCSRCGHTERANRQGNAFRCRACGYQLHADVNASRNIRLRGILARQALCQDGASSSAPEVQLVDPASKAGESMDKPPGLPGGT